MTRTLPVRIGIVAFIFGIWLLAAASCRADGDAPVSGQKRGLLLALAFSRDGKRLVTGGDSVRVYDVASGKKVREWFSASLCV